MIQMVKTDGHIGPEAARREIGRQPIRARKREAPHKGPHNGSNARPGPEQENAANPLD